MLQDLTDHMRLASEVDVSSRFQTVFARIGELAVSEVPVQSIMNEAVQLTAEALRVELCKILIPRDSQEFLYEVAPRPHNSGHFTFGACVTSQFEQHLRAICGLPLGNSSLMRPVLMVNLLGDLWRNGPPRWDRLLAHPQVRLHLYGKTQAGPGRKMGHFLLLTESPEQALTQAEFLLQRMMEADSQEKRFPLEHPAQEPFQKRSRPLESPA